jgi:hypothetical protein
MAGWRAGAALVLIGFLGACTPVKGSPRKHATSSDAAAAAGAAGASGSFENVSGAGGKADETEPRVTNPTAGTGGMPVAGATPVAGSSGTNASPSGAAGAAADPSEPTNGEVRGRVIDWYLQPVAAVQVTIGATTTTTDSNGAFLISGVASTYDATLLLTNSPSEEAPRYVWRFEGLTRRDPTLQVDIAGEFHSGALELHINGVDFNNLASGETVLMSFGSPSGVVDTSFDASEIVRQRLAWQGPLSARFTAHALRFLKLPNEVEPSEFVGYDDATFDLDADGSVVVALDLTRQPLALTRTLNGTFERPPGTQPGLRLYLRFSDNALLPVIVADSPDVSFDYALPNVPGATFTVMAILESGDSVRIMHVDHLDGSAPVAITLPNAPTLGEPASGALVSSQSVFKWSGDGSLFVFRARRAAGRNDVLSVVTSKREATLPSAPGYELPANNEFRWWVETHGAYANVDQAAGPQGFLDTCASRIPVGPERGMGTYTESLGRSINTQ